MGEEVDRPPLEISVRMPATKSASKNATCINNNTLQIDGLTEDVLVDIFQFLGAEGTSKCSMVSRHWNQVVQDSRCLWHVFAQEDFGYLTTKGMNNQVLVDWRGVYQYLAEQRKALKEDQKNHGLKPLNPRVVFSDDGSPVPGYPPENAIRLAQKGSLFNKAWCTNSQVDHDVDLVLELPAPSLIAAFEAANGGYFYSAPLHQALVFTSNTPIDIEQARQFNGKKGAQWANSMTLDDHPTIIRQVQQYTEKHKHTHQPTNLPIAAFNFPPPPSGFNARQQKLLPKIIVARYIHFKLLNSHKSPDGRLADNIDVKDLLTLGTELPLLDKLLQLQSSSEEEPQQPNNHDPSYKRLHAIREYNPPNPNEWW
ncbi:expressed unknown protein [Seminavis robusta]|uniref:F-box domain-containing protein n=1 Tax=Seminavis robusta TaxID=568900 RepID=A0A9N8DRF8_9STRA|nr:expressed unknown protein [Seminavis robusta]|eukprot:Sro201_g085090.1 n/a (368) ;mRNA; f:52910-54013